MLGDMLIKYLEKNIYKYIYIIYFLPRFYI